jgi:TRAP-type C4-dicarboxylate transport system permease small subunit
MKTMIGGFSRLVEAIDRLSQAVVACLVGIMVTVVFAQVIFRYALVRPIFWADELSRYLFVWIAFVGAVVAMGSHLHYGFDYVMERCPFSVRRAVGVLMSLLTVGFFLLCLIAGFEAVWIVSGQKSPSLQISMGWVYAALPVGSMLMLLHLVEQAFVQPEQGGPARGIE